MCRVPVSYVLGFYKISFATKLGGKFRYGQGTYDFDEGSIVFAAPSQIVGKFETEVSNEGISLFIHPHFFTGLSLSCKDQTVWILFLRHPRSIAFVGTGKSYYPVCLPYHPRRTKQQD